MRRPFTGCVCVALIAASSGAASSSPRLDFLQPTPAQPSTARLAVATGTGDERLALWFATNSRAELCLGSVLGASTSAPARFTCLRKGLERPVLTVEGGGGLGGQITWGVLSGLAAPGTARVSVAEGLSTLTRRDLDLAPLEGHPGWHVFTTGVESRPPNELDAWNANNSRVIRDLGIWIHTHTACNPCVIPPPPINGQAPAASGPSWTDTYSRLGVAQGFTPPFSATAADTATTLALALSALRNVLSYHSAWLEETLEWNACGGRPLGYIASFRFLAPASFTAALPMIDTATSKSAYSTSVGKVRAANWSELNVSVDTNVGAVVGVDSRPYVAPDLPEGTTTILKTIISPHDSGGPDNPAPCSHD